MSLSPGNSFFFKGYSLIKDSSTSKHEALMFLVNSWQYVKRSPLTTLGLCSALYIFIVLPIIISKEESRCLPKGVDLRLSNTRGRASGHGRLKDSTSLAN